MAIRDLNTIMLTGRVDGEPEMRYTGAGELYTTFYLVGAFGGGSADLDRLRLLAWGDWLAERCNRLLADTRVLVEGQLQRCSAEDEQERRRFPLEVRVCDVIVTSRSGPALGPRPLRASSAARKER